MLITNGMKWPNIASLLGGMKRPNIAPLLREKGAIPQNHQPNLFRDEIATAIRDSLELSSNDSFTTMMLICEESSAYQ